MEDIADAIANSFNVAPINDYSNVLQVIYETENPRLGRDIVNQLMLEYNESSIEDKRIITVNTLQFIEESLEQEVQLKVLGFLANYLDDESKIYRTVPVSLGIGEPSLQVLIAEYNSAQLKRETQLKTTTPSNQIIQDIDTELEKLREQMKESLVNIRQAYIINRDNLKAKTLKAENEISGVPGKGRRMLEITRQQKILEDL